MPAQILLEGPGDYVVSDGSSRCIQMVQNAAARIKQSRLMFTPTLFWVDSSSRAGKTVNSQARRHTLPGCRAEHRLGSSICCVRAAALPPCSRDYTCGSLLHAQAQRGMQSGRLWMAH